jgi:DNA uptake protein ComE-like DNA-binding protein
MFKGLQEFFNYTKDQRRGIYVMTLLILLLMAGLYVDDYFYPSLEEDISRFEQILAQNKTDSLARVEKRQMLLKPFYADTATSNFWQTLGFSGSSADRISSYQKKVGAFRKPRDLYKIYGIDSALVTEVLPYLKIRAAENDQKNSRFTANQKPLNLKPFDPNTASLDELLAMGLKPWEAKGILSFRNKFRPFKNDSDIFKVYNIDSALARKLYPLVQISQEQTKPKLKPVVWVNINNADSLELLTVSGIGAYTAHKILKARNSLGGFYSVNQLAEVYPLNKEKLQEIQHQLYAKGPVKRLSINGATFKELIAHPYLNYDLVKGIVSFREKIRPFKAVDELKQIELFNEERFSKIAPYLSVE